MKLTVIIEKDHNGYFGYCPELPGCHTQGDTLDELMENLKEAIELYLETMPPEERAALSKRDIMTAVMEFSVGQAA